MDVIIGLGGNVGDVEAAFNRAVDVFGESDGFEVCSRSSLYRTDPVGPQQAKFLNAAIMVRTENSPRDLLHCCLAIEKSAGRNRGVGARWGPRTLDLDLLIGDSLVCRGPRLELPHPRLVERAFALVPAAEIAPGWIHPHERRTLFDLAEEILKGTMKAVELIGSW